MPTVRSTRMCSPRSIRDATEYIVVLRIICSADENQHVIAAVCAAKKKSPFVQPARPALMGHLGKAHGQPQQRMIQTVFAEIRIQQ